jgi:hypothetical protein
MKKNSKDSKQMLFEMMQKVNPDFKASNIVALIDTNEPKISNVLNPNFLKQNNLQSYSNITNFILKGKSGYWLDVGTVYSDDILNNTQYKKITSKDLNNNLIVDEIKKSLKLFKTIQLSDDLEHVDFNFYQNILP